MTTDHRNLDFPNDFDALDQLFGRQGALCSPSELHGFLCGLLGAGSRPEPGKWLVLAGEQMDMQTDAEVELKSFLLSLHQHTLQQLEDSGYAFQLLMPEEDEDVSFKAAALGQWCQGFLSGFGLSGKQALQHLSEDAQGALNDFTQISQVGEDADNSEQSEADLYEIYEYVRMGVLLIFTDCNPRQEKAGGDQPSAPDLLH
jgi:hypothetical protein